MKGIQYVTNEVGKRTAVLIDLLEWGEIWEDIQDVLVSESRKNENTVSWKKLRTEIKPKIRVGGTIQR